MLHTQFLHCSHSRYCPIHPIIVDLDECCIDLDLRTTELYSVCLGNLNSFRSSVKLKLHSVGPGLYTLAIHEKPGLLLDDNI